MHRQEIIRLLQQHKTPFMDEASYVRRALAFIEEHEDCFYRELQPAHVTASAWVVNPEHTKILMLLHGKHYQWFQPGGHADGDSNVEGVALRELQEETGLDASQLKLLNQDVFDVDIHHIPPHDNEPEHQHIDIRFLVEIDDSLSVPGSDESHDVRWVELFQVPRYNNNRSTFRMLEKTRMLRNINTFSEEMTWMNL